MRLRLNTSGSVINVVRAGPRGRAPVLFIHAVGLDLTWWDAQFATLGREHDLVALDLPGHGLSERLDGPITFAVLASVVGEVVEHLDAGPVHLVGLSVGGMIAQMLALRRPDLVRSLTLVATLCTFADPVRQLLRERAHIARQDGMAKIAPLTLERWFPAAFREARPDVLDRAAKSLLAHDPADHAAMWDMIATLDLETHIHAIGCPTLVVAGGDDGSAPMAAGQKICSLIGGASFQALAGVGHLPPVEAPRTFNHLIKVHFASA